MQGVRRALALIAVSFVLPLSAHAQVVIDEIMYNPQGSDTGREWVELYNAGSSDVTMLGGSATKTWKLNDGSNHTLTDPSGGTGRGSLTIPAGGYLVIASDPSEFISGEYAGGAYSVVKSSISLTNAGATISLIDNTSGTPVTVDAVSYTSAQGAADDGSSLQKQPDGSWIAALPTPGLANSSVAYAAPADNSDSSSSSSSTSTQSTSSTSQTATQTSSYVPPPSPSLYADAGSDRTVIVGADVEFDGLAYDKNQNPLDDSTTRFMWNFGDGATAEGSSVQHHFDYPGRYAVVLSIANQKFSVSDTITVTAEPAAIFFDVLPDGSVSIKNLASHTLDLSEWVVRQNASTFASRFILPADSIILAGGEIHISPKTLQFSATTDASLLYPNGSLALGANQSSATSSPAVTPIPVSSSVQAAVAPVAPTNTTPAVSEADLSPAPPEDAEDTSAVASDTTSTSSAQTAAAGLSFKLSLWWVGALLLVLLGGGALMLSRSASKGEWDIEDLSK